MHEHYLKMVKVNQQIQATAFSTQLMHPTTWNSPTEAVDKENISVKGTVSKYLTQVLTLFSKVSDSTESVKLG